MTLPRGPARRGNASCPRKCIGHSRGWCVSAGFFVEGVRAMSMARRRQMIERAHAGLSIAAQCRLVSISRSSFSYAPVPETAETLALMAAIDASFLDHPWYGSRQMARHLKRLGHAVGRRRVRRLMARMELAPIYQRPTDERSASRAPDLPVSAARSGDHPAGPPVVRRHDVSADAAWFPLSRRRHGPSTGSGGRAASYSPGGCRTRWTRHSVSRR